MAILFACYAGGRMGRIFVLFLIFLSHLFSHRLSIGSAVLEDLRLLPLVAKDSVSVCVHAVECGLH